MKTLSYNAHKQTINFIEDNNKFSKKKQTECLKDDIKFSWTEPEKPNFKKQTPKTPQDVSISISRNFNVNKT